MVYTIPGTAHNGYGAVSDRFPKAYTYRYLLHIYYYCAL